MSLTGAWVALLAARGYSLMEIGIAETVFHIAAIGDDALQVRTNTVLQDMFPAEQRTTLISVESFTFSVLMVVLSPLAGALFSWW